MQSALNLKIKLRESFRPFAPAVLRERAAEYFDLDRASPYMLLTADVAAAQQKPVAEDVQGLDKLGQVRSTIPAVTHVDGSARVQTVTKEVNPDYHALLSEFERQTGCAVLVNTSFNVRGEPIVCTPEDAYRCFMRTEMDYLVVENFLMAKPDQPVIEKDDSWKEEFALD